MSPRSRAPELRHESYTEASDPADGQDTTRIGIHLTPEDVLGRTWTFGVRDRPPYAPFVRFLPDGRIAGFASDNVNERSWTLEDGQLAILDAWDRRTTEFDEARMDRDGRLALDGAFRMHPAGTPHRLQEIPSPDALAPAGTGPELRRTPGVKPRRNLVVLRANEHSLHHQWRPEMTNEDRNWDLCVSFYGADENFRAEGFGEYHVLQNKQYKFAAIYDLLHHGSPLWDYDYIMLPDDDLMMSWRDINEIFAICREYKLQLAQPALDRSGHVTHPITGRHWPYLLRYTSFVEVMTPVFSREALLACAPSFNGVVGGFGLDNIWPKLLGEPRDAVAVIDKVPVVHTRAQGANYDIGRALQEGDALQRVYNAHNKHVEYGGVLAQPLNRANGW